MPVCRYQEKFYFNPGDTGFKVFHTKFATIGVAICWDQWFPEGARAMALQGAEVHTSALHAAALACSSSRVIIWMRTAYKQGGRSGETWYEQARTRMQTGGSFKHLIVFRFSGAVLPHSYWLRATGPQAGLIRALDACDVRACWCQPGVCPVTALEAVHQNGALGLVSVELLNLLIC